MHHYQKWAKQVVAEEEEDESSFSSFSEDPETSEDSDDSFQSYHSGNMDLDPMEDKDMEYYYSYARKKLELDKKVEGFRRRDDLRFLRGNQSIIENKKDKEADDSSKYKT